MSFGGRLKSARNKKKLTQEDVAVKLGIDDTTISKYENDKSEPDNQTLKRLSDLYECSIDYLMGKTNNPTQVLTNETREFVTDLGMTDDEIMEKYKLKFKGRELSPETIKKVLSYARYLAEENQKD